MKILILFFVFSMGLAASVPLKPDDEQLAAKTDHVLIGRVIGVDMINDKGKQVTDDRAMTGPGSKNIIRLKIKIDETLVTNVPKVPALIHVALDPFMHYQLGQVKKVHTGKTPKTLILLSGKKFTAPVAGIFRRNLKQKSFFVNRVKKKHHKSTPGK